MGVEASPGFFGKLPAVGDFVSRRLPRSFLDPWDDWLQAAMTSSREQLGESWLDDYLTSPIWRFALSAEVAGSHPCGGILMPSVDKAGRYFPFTLATFLPMNTNLFEIAGIAHAWFEEAETVALSILDEQPPDIESLDSKVEALGMIPVAGVGRIGNIRSDMGDMNPKSWHIGMSSVTGLLDTLPSLVHRLAEFDFGYYSLWWTAGSEKITSALLLCEGLPPATGYSAMLGGGWQEHGWIDLSAYYPAAKQDHEAQSEACS